MGGVSIHFMMLILIVTFQLAMGNDCHYRRWIYCGSSTQDIQVLHTSRG